MQFTCMRLFMCIQFLWMHMNYLRFQYFADECSLHDDERPLTEDDAFVNRLCRSRSQQITAIPPCERRAAVPISAVEITHCQP
jgi:hypothetical protein